MPLTVTPGQLTQRSEFYHQLGQLTGAGLGILQALDQLQRNPPARSYKAPIRQVHAEIVAGCTMIEAFRTLGNWLPEFDLALLHAGESSGRLQNVFRLLADHYRDRARLARQMIADLLYPVFLIHFAVFILPFAQFFASGNWMRYLFQTLGILIPLYAVIGLMIYAAQGRHGETWRSLMEILLHPIPVLGNARRCLALSRLAGALEALLSAGITIIEAWGLAATACGSPAIRRTVEGWKPALLAGETPAEVLNASGQFPAMFAGQYQTGEISGQLEETLGRLRDYYQEEGSRKLHLVASWTPRGVYLIVALLIAWRVVAFYSGYFKDIQNAGGF